MLELGLFRELQGDPLVVFSKLRAENGIRATQEVEAISTL